MKTVLFFKAKMRGDDRTMDMFGDNPVLAGGKTTVHSHTTKRGVFVPEHQRRVPGRKLRPTGPEHPALKRDEPKKFPLTRPEADEEPKLSVKQIWDVLEAGDGLLGIEAADMLQTMHPGKKLEDGVFTRKEARQALAHVRVNGIKARREKAKAKLTEQHGDDPLGMEVSTDDGRQHALILPDASEPGKFRFSKFDSRGFFTHQTFKTPEEALDSLVADGFRTLNPGVLDKLSLTPEWAEGMEQSAAIQRLNSMSEQDRKIQRILDAELAGRKRYKVKKVIGPRGEHYAFADENGITYGKQYKTDGEAKRALAASEKRETDEFRTEVKKMDAKELDKQHNYWVEGKLEQRKGVFKITTTPAGRFRAESRFQRLGVFKTREAAEKAIATEKERLAFMEQAAAAAPQTYQAQMRATAKAEKDWAERQAKKPKPKPKPAPTSTPKKPVVRGMDTTGRPTDGMAIMPKDKFRTASGRVTTPFPHQKRQKYVSQWMVDNAVAEAQSRGDEFNAHQFAGTGFLRGGALATADYEAITEYLFGEQPDVARSVLRDLA